MKLLWVHSDSAHFIVFSQNIIYDMPCDLNDGGDLEIFSDRLLGVERSLLVIQPQKNSPRLLSNPTSSGCSPQSSLLTLCNPTLSGYSTQNSPITLCNPTLSGYSPKTRYSTTLSR